MVVLTRCDVGFEGRDAERKRVAISQELATCRGEKGFNEGSEREPLPVPSDDGDLELQERSVRQRTEISRTVLVVIASRWT